MIAGLPSVYVSSGDASINGSIVKSSLAQGSSTVTVKSRTAFSSLLMLAIILRSY